VPYLFFAAPCSLFVPLCSPQLTARPRRSSNRSRRLRPPQALMSNPYAPWGSIGHPEGRNRTESSPTNAIDKFPTAEVRQNSCQYAQL
jgi:hypothetical protein